MTRPKLVGRNEGALLLLSHCERDLPLVVYCVRPVTE